MILNFLKNNELNESMTDLEEKTKRQIISFLCRDGFPKFGDYLENFHINFVTSDVTGELFVAAVDADRGVVYINPKTTLDACSVILRHEIGHVVFKHREHFLAKLKKLGINTPSRLAHRLANICGDYHISNEIYDQLDKKLIKGMLTKEDGELVRILEDADARETVGLVTEFDFPENPEYWTMDFDQLWDVFVKDYDPKELNAETATEAGQGVDPALNPGFIEGWNEIMNAFNNGEITKEDIAKILNELK